MKISVITPSLNSGEHIERAIQSVLAQNYDNFEHIIVDGLSTDNTLDILKKYPHLTWVSEKDSGQSNAMNKGFAMSSGEIIVYLNADDYFLPEAFLTVLPHFEEGEKFVVGDIYQVDLHGNQSRRRPKYKHIDILHHWTHWGTENDIIFAPFPLNPVQYFYHREVQEDFPFNETNHYTMDLEFLMDASSKYDFFKIDDILGTYILYNDAKSIVASNDVENYWTFENFSYVDRFIENWDEDQKKAFKQAQQKGYLQRALSQKASQEREKLYAELKHKDEQLHIKQKIIQEKDDIIRERGKLYDVLKEKDEELQKRQKIIEGKDKIIKDMYQMVSTNNPLYILKMIRYLKRVGKKYYE